MMLKQREPMIDAIDARWQALYRIGGATGLIAVAIIPVSIAVFMVWPPPDTVLGHFARLQENRLLGLLGMDLLYLLANILLIPMMVALYFALRRTNESLIVLAIVLYFIGTILLFVANPLVEMMTLSDQYAAATTEAQRVAALGAGEAMLARDTGTAYHLHYIIGTIGLLIVSTVMLRSAVFSNVMAYLGFITNVLAFGLYVPTIGVALSAVSGIGYLIWFTRIARRLLQLGNAGREPMPHGT